jgi:uncharacterized protein YprB with RNaseH-like and TPR domain
LSTLTERIREIVAPPGQVRRADPEPAVAAADPKPVDLAALGGGWADGCFVVERQVEPAQAYGRETIGAVAESLNRSAAAVSLFAGAARAPFMFVDLETTGLSGGAGTHIFLFGCGWFTADGAFATRQLLLTRFEDEPRLLRAVTSELGRAGTLVSFNGKSFDAPLLETRFEFHRLDWIGSRMAHVDVLHPARRFWPGVPGGPGVRGGCSLAALERRVGAIRRSDDVPGFEVPALYFRFIRSGDGALLAPVLEHNRLDLLTVAALLSRLLRLSQIGAKAARTAGEALALGRLYMQAGVEDRAYEALNRSIEMSRAAPAAFDPVRIDAMWALAQALRHRRRFDEAAAWWQRLAETCGCPAPARREAIEALAIHHEHRVRDLPAARTFALRNLEEEQPPSRTRAVEHRLARLDRKLERRKQDLGLFAFV